MNPVILIATHQRYQITAANIRSLYPLTVVIVVTDIHEADLYRDFHNVIVVMAANEPLGAKWQAGVEAVRKMPHSHLVITGSDDILATGFADQCSSLGYDFIGLRSWYVLFKKRLYHIYYQAKDNLPLGGGRVYSKALLERMDYKVFDTGKHKLLDDQGWEIAKKSKHMLIKSPKILAVKGEWECMNPFNIKHPNIRVVAHYGGEQAKQIIETDFKYDSSGVL